MAWHMIYRSCKVHANLNFTAPLCSQVCGRDYREVQVIAAFLPHHGGTEKKASTYCHMRIDAVARSEVL